MRNNGKYQPPARAHALIYRRHDSPTAGIPRLSDSKQTMKHSSLEGNMTNTGSFVFSSIQLFSLSFDTLIFLSHVLPQPNSII